MEVDRKGGRWCWEKHGISPEKISDFRVEKFYFIYRDFGMEG